MDKKRRIDVRSILAQPDLCRALMVPTIQATQAREGIETTREQAERAYYIVTEAERVAFFALRELSGGLSDRRETGFAQALGIPLDDAPVIRYDVARRDFGTIPRSPLSYAQVAILSQLVRENPRLDPGWACARGGMNSTESPRFVRYWWEPSPNTSRRWVPYSKGGSYARFYSDLELVFDWTDHGSEFRQIVKRKYGSESRFVKSPEFYFRRGITWTEKSSLGFSARLLEEGAIFNVAGPAAFPNRQDDEWYLLGVLNSDLLAYVAWAFSGRSYGASYIAALPIAPRNQMSKRIAEVAKDSHAFKAAWDQGNEASTRFDRPWILMKGLTDETMAIGPRLDELVAREAAEDARIQELYAALNDAVYQQYGIPDRSRASIEETLGKRPLEVLWPQMEGKTVEQKRMEHVFRLLSYTVKRVVEADADGIVPFTPAAGEQGLAERVHGELQAVFPKLDVGQIEVEITNELKKNVKGYRRTNGITEWLESAFFEFHCSLYKSRPILWHVASSRGPAPFAFGALVHYHRFDKNRMAQLRAQYLRDAIDTFRHEAALADKAGRIDARQDWQARLEEAQELDRRLQGVQEGRHEGPEGGDRDYRILTPWKASEDRLQGWTAELDDGVKVNIEPLQKAGVLRVAKVV